MYMFCGKLTCHPPRKGLRRTPRKGTEAYNCAVREWPQSHVGPRCCCWVHEKPILSSSTFLHYHSKILANRAQWIWNKTSVNSSRGPTLNFCHQTNEAVGDLVIFWCLVLGGDRAYWLCHGTRSGYIKYIKRRSRAPTKGSALYILHLIQPS